MRARIYKTSQGFDVINSLGELFCVNGNQVKKIGTIGKSFKPSGTLLKRIPKHIRNTFYKLNEKHTTM